MEYRILERLEVTRDGQQLALGGSKQRALLAVLLLHRRSVVSLDRLVEHLWGECPPRTAEKTIQVYVSRLRKLLGASVLQTVGRGYRLAVEPGQVDVDRFETLVTGGRAALGGGDAMRAIDLLDAALSLCPEQPLEEFRDEPFGPAEISRLQEARLAALEDRIEAELGTGRGAELVPQLQRSVAQHPLRERLIAGLMLALYHGGRQSDALATYRAAHERLVEELGLEPGPELRNLERRILEHDETLMAARPARGSPPRPRRHRGRTAVTLGVPLAVLVLATFVLGFGSDPPHVARLGGAGGLVAVNAGSGRVMIASPQADSVAAVDYGQGSIWVADPGTSSIDRVDPRSGAVDDRIVVGGQPAGVVSGDGAIWTVGTVGATVTRIDPGTGTVTQRIQLPAASLSAMSFGSGALWLADSIDGRLFEIDPQSGTLRRSLSLELQPSAVTVADGALWVTGYDSATVEKIDPASGRTIGRADAGDGPVALTYGAGSIWVANSLDSTVSRIDPATLKRQSTIPVGSGPSAIAVVGGSVWVANQYSGSVFRIDPRRNAVAAKVSVGGSPTSLTAGAARLWVGNGEAPGGHRGGTLRIVATQRFASLDPAFFYNATNPQFIGLTYDTLVTFNHSGTDAGLRLVPDLALSLPKPTDAGATYTFRLRPGIRYSDGQPLQALDFRRAIERLFRVHSPGASLFLQVSGSAECQRRPAKCSLSRGIVTDDAARTVTFHLSTPDPDFLFTLTEEGFSAPIPPGTPDRAPQSSPPAGTGPYRVLAATNTEIRFGRNPFFREWSHAAQPSGNPDAIDWRFVTSARDAVSAVTRTRADWFFGLIPLAQYRSLKLEDPGLLESNPQFSVEFIPLNTRRAPFDDVRARRALNYAIDRGLIARIYGGSDFATPTCQPLAPGLPGYSRYCPYTLHPAGHGAWRAPDLAKARRLVRASGTQGERVDVWGPSDQNYVPPGVADYVAGVLRTLGYHVRLHLVPYESITEAQRMRFQLSTDGDWLADYPEPSSYLPLFLSCSGGDSNQYYCNPRLDGAMRRTTKLNLSNPMQASRGWTSIDHQLTNDAPWVPTVNTREVDLVSSRVRNYQFNPVWGFLPDLAWLR